MDIASLHYILARPRQSLVFRASLLFCMQVGLVNSAMLIGYLTGQLPAGWLADKMGGERCGGAHVVPMLTFSLSAQSRNPLLSLLSWL